MGEKPPPIHEAVENREEMVRDMAERRGLTAGDLLGHLEMLELLEDHEEIRPVSPDEIE